MGNLHQFNFASVISCYRPKYTKKSQTRRSTNMPSGSTTKYDMKPTMCWETYIYINVKPLVITEANILAKSSLYYKILSYLTQL